MKRSDISDRVALEACWPYGEPNCSIPLLNLMDQGFPQKVAVAKMKHLCDKGLVEYGVSVAYAWRTPEGEALLREQASVR